MCGIANLDQAGSNPVLSSSYKSKHTHTINSVDPAMPGKSSMESIMNGKKARSLRQYAKAITEGNESSTWDGKHYDAATRSTRLDHSSGKALYRTLKSAYMKKKAEGALA